MKENQRSEDPRCEKSNLSGYNHSHWLLAQDKSNFVHFVCERQLKLQSLHKVLAATATYLKIANISTNDEY